jgi:hypothetical protein
MPHTATRSTPTSDSASMTSSQDHAASNDSVPPPEQTSQSSPLEQIEILRYILSFVGNGHYRFIGAINRQFNEAYKQIYPDDMKTYLSVSTLDLAEICYKESMEHRPVLCRCAARYGNLEVLQYLRSLGCTWDSSTCHKAAKHGHLHILMYARKHHCPWGRHTIYFAAIHGHVHILLWSQMNGCSGDDDHIVRGAVQMNHKKNLIDYLHQQITLE